MFQACFLADSVTNWQKRGNQIVTFGLVESPCSIMGCAVCKSLQMVPLKFANDFAGEWENGVRRLL